MTNRERLFIKDVRTHYRRHGRGWLPWRKTRDPYHVLVSEVMCQQTQVERVVPKYEQFLKMFPDMHSLACAPLGDVLRLWQGLGYNRRAKMLNECARGVVNEYGGLLPQLRDELARLPGIGPYTAGAVMVFAYNEAVPLIETNIRSAYLYHFFEGQTAVSDAKILRYIEVTMDRKNPREWFSALMDYGAHIKREFGNQNARSKTYAKQSRFSGSDREIRGAILRTLAARARTHRSLVQTLAFEPERLSLQLEKLTCEGMVEKNARIYRLPG